MKNKSKNISFAFRKISSDTSAASRDTSAASRDTSACAGFVSPTFGTLALLAFFASLFLQANLALANAEVTLTVKNPDPMTGNQSWFVYNKNPGDTIEDIATIKNYGDESAIVKIYPVDATTSESGSFILKFDHDDQEGIGDWTEVKEQRLTINPNERIDVPFKISIPKELSPGQYIGGIVIEYGTAADKNAKINNSVVNVKTRIGSRIYVTIPGAVQEKVNMSDFGFYFTLTGQPRFKFRIENNGNVAYSPIAQIEVRDSSGKLYDSFSKSLGMIMPNSVTTPTIAWDRQISPFANYTATAQITFNKKFQSAGDTMHGTALSKSINFWIIPWSQILYTLLLISVCAGICLFRVVRLKKMLATSEIYHVDETDDLIAIAKKCHVSWKQLAALNKLKAPYIIKKGHTIYVPKKKHD